MNLQLELIFFALLIISVLIIFFWIIRTENRLKRFFLGKKAKDLEDTIILLQKDIAKLKNDKDAIEGELAEVKQKMKKSVRGLETIRFNPFPDQGGNQSFAIGMLDEEGDGVVLSSLYSRERMSIYAKPIKAGKSQFELTEEERNVLEKAKVR